MSGNNANKINHCLNRLILTEMKDPDKLNPYIILKEICDFENLQEMKKLFRKCCQVSLSEEYIWDEGIPGNLLYIYEQLEKLIESCYLIYRKKGFKKKTQSQQTRQGVELRYIQAKATSSQVMPACQVGRPEEKE